MEELKAIAGEALKTFEAIANAARRSLGGRGITLNALASVNEMTASNVATEMQQMNDQRQGDCVKLLREPAIARLVIADEDDNRQALYISSGGTVGSLPVAFCSYMSPKGQLAALNIGDSRQVKLPSGFREFEVLEKVSFRPIEADSVWDSKPAVQYREKLAPFTIRSLRELLRDDGVAEAAIDTFEAWAAAQTASAGAGNVIEGIQRDALTAMQLRVAPILDAFQDKIFRLPIDTQIAVLGPPGTGKTTTLIKRLRQKVDFAYLDPETELGLVQGLDAAGLTHADSWLMFTPTELLRQYVKEAFGKEGVPVHDERVRTWDDYRREVGRRNLGILRAAHGGSGLVLKNDNQILLPETIANQIPWFEAFDAHQEALFVGDLEVEAQRLQEAADPRAATLGKQILDAITRNRGIPLQLVSELANLGDRLRAVAAAGRDEQRTTLQAPLNAYARSNPNFLDELMRFVESLNAIEDDEAEAEEADGDEDDDAQLTTTIRDPLVIPNVFLKAMRSRAIAQATGRTPAAASRAGRLLAWLRERGLELPDLRKLGTTLLVQRSAQRLTAQHLRLLSVSRRRATLVATVLDTIARLTDDGVALFDRAVGRMFRRAEVHEEDALLRDARAVNDKVRLLAKLGTALIKAKADDADLDKAVATSVGWEKLAASVAQAERLARPDKADLPALAARAWPVLHRLGPVFLDAFNLRAVPAAASTLRAVELLHDAYRSDGRTWPQSPPVSFLRAPWRDAVLGAANTANSATGSSPVSSSARRIWEAATLLALRDRLRAGDIWVEGSRQWRAVEDQLITPALFTAMRAAGPLPIAAPATAAEYLAERRTLLDRRLAEVAAKAAADALEDVRIKGGDMKISPLRAVTPEAAEELAARLYAMLPAARITSLLAEVHGWTGLANLFTHQQTDLPADDPRVVLTGVLAEATNLGLSRMADACAVASRRKLAWIAAWHLREETYRSALALLVNAQQRQPLAAMFGAAGISSSDGQGFPTAGRGEAVGAINAHYGRDVSALFYTHLSARYAPYHTVAIPPSGEAAHVIDGLLYHEADLSIAVHHTDGGGVSDHVFAVAPLLGVRFAPRIPNIAERRLYAFGPASNWPALAPFIAGRADERLITAHWDDVLRLTVSVRTGAVSASLMLKRLGAYPRQNGLALALREIGRIERTLYTLDWLEQPPLRRQATAELNKGESRNALARAVCFHRLGRLRDRTAELQQHRASGLTLVTAAIVLWNTVYLGRALDALRRSGEVVPDELLAHIAPLGWQHINLTGDYLWDADDTFAADGFRALRGVDAQIAHAA